jgi:hypothetical protein
LGEATVAGAFRNGTTLRKTNRRRVCLRRLADDDLSPVLRRVDAPGGFSQSGS